MLKKLLLSGLFSIPYLFLAQNTSKAEPRVSIIPSIGYAWRLGKTPTDFPKDLRDHVKGLKSGVDFSISAYYHVGEGGAFGLKFSNYSASNDSRITSQDLNGTFSVPISTKDNITFIGPAYMFSNFSEDVKHKVYGDIALGIISYTSKSGNVEATGSNLGMETNIAYQYALTKHIYIGPKLGYTAGTLTKMKFNGISQKLEDGEKEGLHRLSLSAAVSFRF